MQKLNASLPHHQVGQRQACYTIHEANEPSCKITEKMIQELGGWSPDSDMLAAK